MSNSSSGRYVAKYVWTIIHDGIDNILMCMAEWCFAFLKWWMMGCDISGLATTGNFIMVALSLVLVTGCTYRMHWCVREVWCVLCCLAWWWYDQLCTEIKSEWDLYLNASVSERHDVLCCTIVRDTDRSFIHMHRYCYWHRYGYWWWCFYLVYTRGYVGMHCAVCMLLTFCWRSSNYMYHGSV